MECEHSNFHRKGVYVDGRFSHPAEDQTCTVCDEIFSDEEIEAQRALNKRRDEDRNQITIQLEVTLPGWAIHDLADRRGFDESPTAEDMYDEVVWAIQNVFCGDLNERWLNEKEFKDDGAGDHCSTEPRPE